MGLHRIKLVKLFQFMKWKHFAPSKDKTSNILASCISSGNRTYRNVYFKSIRIQKLYFLSYGCYFTWFFLRVYQSPKVSDGALKIQPPDSSCVWKTTIDPSCGKKLSAFPMKKEVFRVMPLLTIGCDMRNLEFEKNMKS